MRRLLIFAAGVLVGGATIYVALQNHLIRSKKGFHVVPKANATLSKSYVDIRKFTLADWKNNADLALALTNANQFDLIEDAAGDALQNGLDRWLNPENDR